MRRRTTRGPYRPRRKSRHVVTSPLALAIVDARRQAGLTQKQLASLLSIGVETLKKYERGRYPVPWPLFDRLAAHLPGTDQWPVRERYYRELRRAFIHWEKPAG
jgi:ribosome-binding protein aMBF1 (putative translation factor)